MDGRDNLEKVLLRDGDEPRVRFNYLIDHFGHLFFPNVSGAEGICGPKSSGVKEKTTASCAIPWSRSFFLATPSRCAPDLLATRWLAVFSTAVTISMRFRCRISKPNFAR